MFHRCNIFLFFTAFYFISIACSAQRFIEVDVCVYGGSSSGVIAAYTAKKLGKKTILIEPGNTLGGMSSGGLGYADIGNKSAITGLARDFYRKVGSHYGELEQFHFEPHVAERIFNYYVTTGDVEVLMQHRLIAVNKNVNHLEDITLEHTNGSRSENIIVRAKMFIDCSYEGDLMAKAKIPYRVGRESSTAYGETLNGVQLQSGEIGLDPYKTSGKRNTGLLPGISRDTLLQQGTGDHKIQAYGFRICLTSNPDNMVKITRPKDYDSTQYELMLRLFAANPDKKRLNDFFVWKKLPNQKTDIESKGIFSSALVGGNYDYPDGDYQKRKAIITEHERYVKGLLYFLGHDTRVPLMLRNQMLMWGYPKDEYVNNNHWSPQLYIRESRRIIGEYVMTQANAEGKRRAHDPIAYSSYKMQSHPCQRIVVDGKVRIEGYVEGGGTELYPISYRAVIPKEHDATNLLVPVCLSATHIAYTSLAKEPLFMVLGQVVATAASIAIDDQVPVQQVNYKKLHEALRQNPLADSSISDVVIDNSDHQYIEFIGRKWDTEKEAAFGLHYFVTTPDDKRIQTVRFLTPSLIPSMYNLYLYIPKIKNITKIMLVSVFDGTKKSTRVINPTTIESQANGDWISLGQYIIALGKSPYVEISNVNATGKVVADAIMWVPVQEQPSAKE